MMLFLNFALERRTDRILFSSVFYRHFSCSGNWNSLVYSAYNGFGLNQRSYYAPSPRFVLGNWNGSVTVCGQENLSRYISNTKVNSAFRPSGVDESSTVLPG